MTKPTLCQGCKQFVLENQSKITTQNSISKDMRLSKKSKEELTVRTNNTLHLPFQVEVESVIEIGKKKYDSLDIEKHFNRIRMSSIILYTVLGLLLFCILGFSLSKIFPTKCYSNRILTSEDPETDGMQMSTRRQSTRDGSSENQNILRDILPKY